MDVWLGVAAVILNAMVYLIYPALLIIGILLCIKISYRSGQLFFILLLVKSGLSLLFNLYARMSIHTELNPPWGLSIGMYVAAYSIVTNIILNLIQITAFLILLLSLYKKFFRKSNAADEVNDGVISRSDI